MSAGRTAFVLGGGGVLGAVEVGMTRALLERGIVPDLVVGTSIGAINGAVIAAGPLDGLVDRMIRLWDEVATDQEIFGAGPVNRFTKAVRTRTHLHSARPLRRLLRRELGDRTFEDLPTPFQCCAASIERAAEHWFSTGPVVDAVLASAAVPGLLRPVRVGDEHYMDGGIVNSIPLGRAAELGADRVFVLQVGRVERPLTVPQWPWEVARVSFEVARRHRFNREREEWGGRVETHVLPTGGGQARDDSLLAYRDFSTVRDRIEAAYRASRDYLDRLS